MRRPLIILAIALLVMCGIYSCTDADCTARGGHIEMVYGQQAAWICLGATPK